MIYLLLWLFLGSLSVNILWAKVVYDHQLYKRAQPKDFAKGLLFGLLIGPLCLIAALYEIIIKEER